MLFLNFYLQELLRLTHGLLLKSMSLGSHGIPSRRAWHPEATSETLKLKCLHVLCIFVYKPTHGWTQTSLLFWLSLSPKGCLPLPLKVRKMHTLTKKWWLKVPAVCSCCSSASSSWLAPCLCRDFPTPWQPFSLYHSSIVTCLHTAFLTAGQIWCTFVCLFVSMTMVTSLQAVSPLVATHLSGSFERPDDSPTRPQSSQGQRSLMWPAPAQTGAKEHLVEWVKEGMVVWSSLVCLSSVFPHTFKLSLHLNLPFLP